MFHDTNRRCWYLFPVSIVILHIISVRFRNPIRTFLGMWRLETYLAAVVQHGPHVGGPKTKWRGVTMQIWIITAVYYNNGHRVWQLFHVSIVILHIVLVRLRNPKRIFLGMWQVPIYLAAAAVNTNFVHRDARPIMGVGGEAGGRGAWR